MEAYVKTIPEAELQNGSWSMPVLRGSGGHLMDPAKAYSEVAVVEKRHLDHQ